MKFFLTTFALVIVLSPPAKSFTLGGSSLLKGFQQSPVEVYLNPDLCPASIESDLKKAIDLWQSVPSSGLQLQYQGLTATAASQLKDFSFPEALVVACSDDFGNDHPNGCDSTCLDFVTAVGGFIGSGLSITKGLVIVNVNSGAQANMHNLGSAQRQLLLAHELGHTLGLGHSSEPSALMYYNLGGKQRLALHQDDMDGISYLYPRDEFGSDPMLACGRVDMSGGSPLGGTPPLWLFVLFLTLWIGLRLRFRADSIQKLGEPL